jgi:hypothetical protein
MSLEFLTFLGVMIALLGVVIAWIVYRSERWSTRDAILRSLRAEQTLHGAWVGTAYPGTKHGSWMDPSYLVHRLGTVALDEAIVRGPGIMFNPQLLPSLVLYRQVLTHFNQLIDQAMAFQATPELWQATPPKHLVDHMLELIEAVHIVGIGDSDQQKAAHFFYKQAVEALEVEAADQVLAVAWAVTGFNLAFIKHWRSWPGRFKTKLGLTGASLDARRRALSAWAAQQRQRLRP